MSNAIFCQSCYEVEATMHDDDYLCMNCYSEKNNAITDIPTLHFRHVFREFNDGNNNFKVLCLQQWILKSSYDRDQGRWKDVEISTEESLSGPRE